MGPDLAMTPTGDLIPTYSGGFTIVSGLSLDLQDINWRAQTQNPDQLLWNIGANLEDMIGLPNTQATGTLGENNMLSALTSDGRFDGQSVTVVAVPLTQNQIQVTVAITNGQIFATSPLFSTVINLNG